MTTFRLRLNNIDHYQSTPSPLDAPIWGPVSLTSTQRINLPQVPVIRVFGATETGQKVCAHIHGALPYLFVAYTESTDPQHVENYITTFRHSADHALALSYRRNPYDNAKNAAFVAHISLVKGIPFFGYNVGYRYFLKIYLLNPLHMTRFTDLLHQGAILKQIFQPYEAHLQYLLQWMCDYNLYGCAYIETDKPRFRLPIPSWDDLDDPTHLWHDRSIPSSSVLSEDNFPRQSHCQLEIDIWVDEILNRHALTARPLHHSFIERLESLENLPPEEKLVHSMAGLWKDETRRRRRRMGLADDSSSPFPPEVLVSMSADPRHTDKGGWIHEAEFLSEVAKLAQQEKKARGGQGISFETFESQNEQDDGVQTILASVEELFRENVEKKWKSSQTDSSDTDIFKDGSFSAQDFTPTDAVQAPIVDETSIANAGDEEDYGSDEDIARHIALTQRQKSGHVKWNGNGRRAATPQPDAQDGANLGNKSALKRASGGSSQSPNKRLRFYDAETSDSGGESSPNKIRQPSLSPSKLKISQVQADGETPPGGQQAQVGVNDDTDQSASPSKRVASQPSSQGNKLPFPAMKNLQDGKTPLRLSQRDKPPGASPKSSQTSSKKKFDALANGSNGLTSPSVNTPATPRTHVDGRLVSAYAQRFPARNGRRAVIAATMPPTAQDVQQSVMPSVIYRDAYYSNERDVPERPREYAGKEFRLGSDTLPYIQPFDATGAVYENKDHSTDKAAFDQAQVKRRRLCTLTTWEIQQAPPSRQEVEEWLLQEKLKPDEPIDELDVDGPPTASQLKRKNRPAPELSQIEGPTQRNKHGFKYSQKKASTSVQHETGYMSTMSLEVHINSRGDLAPDPEKDEVNMIVWCIADEQMEETSKLGILVLESGEEDLRADKIRRIVGHGVQVDGEDVELELINRMVDIVREYDPDILTGYEVHNSSWGYLIERARLQYEFNLPDEFSRMKSKSHGRFGKDADRWGFTHTSTMRITGRHTINIWRAMRSELNLLQYTMENVAFHLLHCRIPHYSFATLTGWYQSGRPRDLAKVVDYFVSRTKLDLEILDANELIPRTSEQARLLGVDFFSVFSRGSQFKVESLMFRIAKPESFVLVSPSRRQVGAQNALECLPLVMEPQSAFYTSPLLVLDFQSLYPSVMIAYNYCYSTCLGRIVNWRGTNKLGFADFKRTPGLLELVKDKLNIAPNGMMYVKPEMRKSLLAKMLGEILETRVMVKSGMKVDKNDKTLQQLLNNRQLALKLIANVTYGYTSASFSGRMPCSEIADSIVQTGRETLEKAIAFIHSIERWGAEVVYGDTDSLFVYLKGRTRNDAFKIGDEIAKAVTDMNPRPVKLKFEKVYHPCVLLAKKRYVGFKYESPQQTVPDFDAKGIETVRRDGTPAEQKMEEKALKLLFRTADLSAVKRYFQAQCTKIMSGRVSVQDFCFAKEVKLGTYADKGPPPPGALIATRRMLRDPRTEPQYGERVPYVVIAGAPGARLWERCVEPERLIYDEHAELDADYYINKNLIPPLERIFNLVGANVRMWYDEMPKVQRIRMLGGPRDPSTTTSITNNPTTATNSKAAARKTMESYMGSSLCLVCRTKLTPTIPARFRSANDTDAPELPLCSTCRYDRTPSTLLALRAKVSAAETKVAALNDVCRSCADLSVGDEVRCDSRDCTVFYSRVKAGTQLRVVERGIGGVLEALEGEAGLVGKDGKEKLEW